MATPMEVSIDRDGCIGCGQCTEICPAVFRMAEDGLAEVYAVPTAAEEDAVREAADSCPVTVIEVVSR